MRATQILADYLDYWIYGSGYVDSEWSRLWGSNDYSNDQWRLDTRPIASGRDVGLVDMSNQSIAALRSVFTQSYDYDVNGNLVYTTDSGVFDMRSADRLTLDHHNVGSDGAFNLALKGVEFVDAPKDQETHLEIITKEGFTTDGTLASIKMNVGGQNMTYTGMTRDSTLFMGAGYDTVTFIDDPDAPGQQFWGVVRREDGELDVYSLFSGYRVQLGDGYKGWTELPSTIVNYGEVEKISLANSVTGGQDVYLPGVDLANTGDRGTATNIDLRSDGQLHSNSFNHAYFNYIRYTSDNIWAGEATIHDGTRLSTPSDRTVTTEKYGYQAPLLDGTMSSVGLSRNGTHDLQVSEQESGAAIDGKLRLYAFDAESEIYNEFNQVYLGSLADESISKDGISGSTPADRVALYGFAGEDSLVGGAGDDYLFGGTSSYDPISTTPSYGNYVVGGDGADYFGVGHTDADGNVAFVSPNTGNALSSNEALDISTSFGTTASLVQGSATDRIGDWDAGTDSLIVLENGVAIIDNIKSVFDAGNTLDSGGDVIDLRSYLASASSDQNGSGARAGDGWDASQTLDFIFENQSVRDALSIINETHPDMIADVSGLIQNYVQAAFDGTDVSVRNDGVIVSQGGAGNDTIHGSFGTDYVYGGAGDNLINVAPTTLADGIDKVFVDGYFGYQEVRGFEGSNDQIYLNKDVLDWIREGNGLGTLTYGQGDFYDMTGAGFSAGQNVSPNLGNVLDNIYFPYKQTYQSILNDPGSAVGSNGAWSNQTHYYADFAASNAMITAGSLTLTIGLQLIPNPWTLPLGLSMIVTGTSQIVAGATTKPHQNAQVMSDERALITLLDAEVAIDTDTATSDRVPLLDFFYASNPIDGFARAIEFRADAPTTDFSFGGDITNPTFPLDTGSASPTIGYYAVHSDDETFIYRVASSDSMVTDNETQLMAEVNGHLTQANLEAYLGSQDIYNTGVEAPDFAPAPTLNVTTTPALSDSGRTSDTTIDLAISLDADLEAGEEVKIYRDGTLIKTLTSSDQLGGDPTSYAYTDDVSSLVASGSEEVFSYSVKTVSSDGIVRSGNNLSLTVDLQAPEIKSATISGDAQVTVVVTGSDISTTEAAQLRLMEGSTVISASDITTSGTPVTLTIPPSLMANMVRQFTLEVVDSRGNLATDSSKIYALSNSDDGSLTFPETPYTILQDGAITFTFEGNDNIKGTNGADILSLGAGTDLQKADLLGGADTLLMTASIGETDADGGAGVDTVDFSQSNTALNVDLAAGTFAFVVGVTPTTATINNFENATGSQYADTLDGTIADNILRGGAGNDTIDGLGGADQLFGGEGADSLTGGTGADIFGYSTVSTEAGDTISDFVSATDTVQFAAADLNNVIGSNTYSPGDVVATDAGAFVQIGTIDGSGAADQSATGTEGTFIYDSNTGQLIFDASGDTNYVDDGSGFNDTAGDDILIATFLDGGSSAGGGFILSTDITIL